MFASDLRDYMGRITIRITNYVFSDSVSETGFPELDIVVHLVQSFLFLLLGT